MVYCRGVVGQSKLLAVVSGKTNVSKVSPGLVILILEFSVQPYMVAWWLIRPTPTAEALVRIPGEAYLIPSFRNGIGV